MTITEVAKLFELSADTLRYYERIGIIPSVNRNPNGIRNYTENDRGWVSFAKCMRNAGLPVEVLIEYVTLFQQGDTTAEARKEILIEQRDKLVERIAEMQETLERLNYKIENYETGIRKAEANLKLDNE
ncbi:MAG: MerR family transcriptional regulator [Acidaminococcaceae bacterium]